MPALPRFPGLGHELREVHVLAVGAEGHQHRKFSGTVGSEYVRAQQRAVAHGHGDVLVEHHGKLRRHGSGFAATSTKAITQGSSLRLLQAWRGARCTRQAPARRSTPPSSLTPPTLPPNTTQ